MYEAWDTEVDRLFSASLAARTEEEAAKYLRRIDDMLEIASIMSEPDTWCPEHQCHCDYCQEDSHG